MMSLLKVKPDKCAEVGFCIAAHGRPALAEGAGGQRFGVEHEPQRVHPPRRTRPGCQVALPAYPRHHDDVARREANCYLIVHLMQTVAFEKDNDLEELIGDV